MANVLDVNIDSIISGMENHEAVLVSVKVSY